MNLQDGRGAVHARERPALLRTTIPSSGGSLHKALQRTMSSGMAIIGHRGSFTLQVTAWATVQKTGNRSTPIARVNCSLKLVDPGHFSSEGGQIPIG